MTTMTMTYFSIDTLQFSKKLQKAGLASKVADEIAEVIKDTHSQASESLATKQDLRDVALDVKVLRQEFELIKQKIDNLEHKLALKMFFLTLAAVTIVNWLDRIITN